MQEILALSLIPLYQCFPHVNDVVNKLFYHLRTISRIRKYLSTQTTEILIHAFVTSKLDHCNSLLYNVSKNVIKTFQSVQNAVARLITRSSRKCYNITLILFNLHWLHVSERIKFKILLLTFKVLHQQPPTYIQELITHNLPSRSLRSSSTLSLNPVSFNLKTFGTNYLTTYHHARIFLSINLKPTFLRTIILVIR